MNPLQIPACQASAAELENELRRRGCAVAIVSPSDVLEQWKENQEADNTNHPEPTEGEIWGALVVIQRMIDRSVYESDPCFTWGPASDACEIIMFRRNKKGGSK